MLSPKDKAAILNEPIPENSAFKDQRLAMAASLCQRVMCEYFSRATEGKLGSIRRNRNNWKMGAATECAELILQLDQKLRQDAAQEASA